MDYNFFKLENLKFQNRDFWKIGFSEKLDFLMGKLIVPNPNVFHSPVTKIKPAKRKVKVFYKYKIKNKAKNFPKLKYLCNAARLTNSDNRSIINYHVRRISLRMSYMGIIYFFSIIPVFIFAIFGFSWFLEALIRALNSYTDSSFLKVILALISAFLPAFLMFFYIMIFAKIIFKIGVSITKKHFADSLCISSVLYLLLDLSQNDILTDTRKRLLLLERVNDLAVNTKFLKYRFSTGNVKTDEWSQDHFNNLEFYIREREKWIIAPTENTLSDIRKDFYELAKIYISGNYGKFKWSEKVIENEEPPLTLSKRLLLYVPKFLGITFPLLIMGYALIYPDVLQGKISPELITLIFISWLLLAIDATLKLGIVSGIINLAKEIKSLK